ncbi:MAG: HEAT repeat domain-containing protein [Anaerolineae bacterium]|nr:HEAT repeat domain-containing protein [Anaerolineae bacterium]
MSSIAKKVSADQMRAAVRAGYRPPGSSSQRMSELGVSTDAFHAQWVQQVMSDNTDWGLCAACAARFEQYAGQAGMSSAPDKAVSTQEIEALLARLKDNDKDAIREVEETIVAIGEPAVEPLIAILKSEDVLASLYVTPILVGIGAPAVEPLIDLLDDPTARIQVGVILLKIRDVRAVKPLIKLLAGELSMVRGQSLPELIQFGEPAIAPLSELLEDEDQNVRALAAEVLEGIRSDSSHVSVSEGKTIVSPDKQPPPGKESQNSMATKTTGTCDITGKEGPVYELPLYKIEQPRSDADELGKLTMAGLQKVKVSESVIEECRGEAGKNGAIKSGGGLLGLVLLIIVANNLPDDSWLNTIVCILSPVPFVLAFMGLPGLTALTTTREKYLQMNLLAKQLTQLSGKYMYYTEALREARLKRLKRRVKVAPSPSTGAAAEIEIQTEIPDSPVAAETPKETVDDRVEEAPAAGKEDSQVQQEKADTPAPDRSGDLRIIERHIADFRKTDVDARWKAVQALVKIGTPAVEPLIAALEDEDENARRSAAETLGYIRDVRAVDPLIDTIRHEDTVFGGIATAALGDIGDARAVEPLIAVLDDEKLRSSAYNALVKIGSAAVEPLAAALQSRDWSVRETAARILGQSRDARAVEPLIAALKDRDEDVRREVYIALKNIGRPAVEPLIAVLKDGDNPVRVKAICLLAENEDPRAVQPLLAMLEDEDEEVRRTAAFCLRKMGHAPQ